ncbi:MAG: DotU family type IV/VI secretion system protein [Gammaproteobacteria bacterium]|nr:DotU family type IV/VI secretion system protein [Gammaproteobacteria bacterium]
MAPAPVAAPEAAAPAAAPRQQSAPPVAQPDDPKAAIAAISRGAANPILAAATPLLVLASNLRGLPRHVDPAGLYRETMDQIRAFEEKSKAAGAQPETVLAARYALCSTIDEAVLSTPWGTSSGWSGQTLLVAFHKEAWGGEKFFLILERLLEDTARNADLLELLYVCLALGFQGKYGIQAEGRSALLEVQHDLYRRLQAARNRTIGAELSPRWKGVEDRRNALVRYVPLWVVAAIVLAIIVSAYIGLRVSLSSKAEGVHAALVEFGREAPAVPSAPPPNWQRLKELLAPEEQQGLLRVEERADSAVVILQGEGWFASGSDQVAEGRKPVLERVTAALNEVQGSVEIVGHTDEVPVKSLKFADNYELSKARAESVFGWISLSINNPGCCMRDGVGPSRPIAPPPFDAAKRAQNRRVEIVVRAGG